ncbi:MAG: HAMP domain-containing sensor histidine kinase [Polyangiaceae bacterium]
MLWSVLQRSRIEARDWLVFGVAILLPLALAAVVGYRALDNEAAARQRETEVELADAARRLATQVHADIASAEKRLTNAQIPAVAEKRLTNAQIPASAEKRLTNAQIPASAEPPTNAQGPAAAEKRLTNAQIGVDAKAAARRVEQVMPRFAVAVVLANDGELRVPEAVRAPESMASKDTECDRDALRIAQRMEDRERAKLAQHLVDDCPDARSESGRLLFPILALDGATKVAAQKLLAWLEARAQSLSGLERDALRDAISRTNKLDAGSKERALGLLARPPSRRGDVAQWLTAPEAKRAVALLAGETSVVRFEDDGVIGVFRRLDSGLIAGFLVTQDSLSRGSSGFELPAELSLATDANGAHSAADIGKGLRMIIGLKDPRYVERLTAQSRRWLAASGVAMAVLALAFGALAFARMRETRRLGELRTDFVSAVSHELRTPIASLRMLAELLEQDRVEEGERAEVHAALVEEARRLGDTIDRLLSFSRMTAGRAVLSRRETVMADPVLASLQAFELSHPGVDVKRTVDSELRANVDPDQVRLALDNLLENAFKYAPAGQPYEVVLAARGDEVVISVEDHGPGIAARDQKRIFEPFERADDRLSRATEGSGIGLGLVRHVAKVHGGRAWVESEPGRGARFLIALPRGVA